MNFIYKNLSVLFLTVLTSCAVQKTNDDIGEVVYSAMTRGSSEKITIVNNQLSQKTNRSAKEYVLSDADRKTLVSVISKINLSEISKLKAPSSKRLYDGAMATNITVKKGETTYTSSTFDDGNPPAELKPLVDLLRSFLKK